MPFSQITKQDVNQAIIEYERDPKKFADRDDKYTLVVNNRSYPPRIIYALAKSIAAGEKVFSKKEITRGVSASFARNELSNLKLTIVPINDPKCEAIASRFVTNPSFERLRSGSKIYKAKLVSFGPACYIGFKFSEQGKGSPKPGLAIYVKKGHGKKQDFIKEFVSFKKDLFKFNDKQASESENTGWVSFCRDDCNSLDDAYNQIVDPGTKRNEWLQFFNDLVEKVKDFVKLGPDPFKTPTELLPPGEHKQELPLKGTDGKILPRNLIWFGAPGTGKSHEAKAKIDKYFQELKTQDSTKEDDTIRTTFHPDSDYASFVGSYKPTMEDCGHSRPRPRKQMSLDELASELKSEYDAAGDGKEKTKILALDLFGEEYSEILQGVNISDLLIKAGLNATPGLKNPLLDSIKVGNYRAAHPEHPEKRIVYSFMPQAFTKAYVNAWKKMVDNPKSPELQFLVIEEINRGNCAQIFGDLFQLLDRADNGYSQYPIDPDTDLATYLRQHLKDAVDPQTAMDIDQDLVSATKADATWNDIREGKKLVLPPNLYIWATMNTSDQSLFPMDSAFKRRWMWKYSKIKDEKQGYKIISDQYDWWEFLQKINAIIREVTSSADKQLGYFFVKLPDDLPEDKRIIDAETFVNKVVFYLWNDVFRDLELNYPAFKIQKAASPKPGDGEEGQEAGALEDRKEQYLTFDHFFKEDSDGVDADRVKTFLDNL